MRWALRLLHHRHHLVRPVREHPPEREGALVERNGDAVEIDRRIDAGQRQRYKPLLPRIAEHQHVGADGIAEQRGRDLVRVHEGRGVRVRGFADRPLDGGVLEVEIAVAHEIADRRDVGVRDHRRAVRQHQVLRGLVHRNHRIESEHEIRRAGDDARAEQLIVAVREADVAVDSPALLREARHVGGRRRLAFEVRGHAEQR